MYQFYISMKEVCEIQAADYALANDEKMSQFYLNAAIGYKMKAEQMNLKVANEDR